MKHIFLILLGLMILYLVFGAIDTIQNLDNVLNPLIRESQLQGALMSLGLAVLLVICFWAIARPSGPPNYRSLVKGQRKHIRRGEDILNNVLKNTNHEEI